MSLSAECRRKLECRDRYGVQCMNIDNCYCDISESWNGHTCRKTSSLLVSNCFEYHNYLRYKIIFNFVEKKGLLNQSCANVDCETRLSLICVNNICICPNERRPDGVACSMLNFSPTLLPFSSQAYLRN